MSTTVPQSAATQTPRTTSRAAVVHAFHGPLTVEEQRRVREHPWEGRRIVEEAVEPPVTEVVTAHHERWDGNGYPRGLAGDRIPLAARVVAVADAYLAMCEDRPYRKRRTTTDAVRELQECAGTQFDPRCVDALVTVISR